MEAETNNDNTTKTANHAWRKKPRQFAPKSRLGCKTCKIRRVKCDQSRPSCQKCSSTGRICDGYDEVSLILKTETRSSPCPNGGASTGSCKCHHCCTSRNEHQSQLWHPKPHDITSQNLGGLMVLPVTGSAQAEAMSFFEDISLKHLDEYHPSGSWRKTLMYFSQTVPAVRCAATALALNHREYLSRDSSSFTYLPQSSSGAQPDEAPLHYYNRAIQLLLNQTSDDSSETTAITLLVSYLFFCFDHLSGNDAQAIKHLHGGVELSRNIDYTILDSNDTYGNAAPSDVSSLMRHVTRQIRRLDMQTTMTLIDWIPVDIQESLVPQLPPLDGAFQSLNQAADHLQVLVAWVLRVRSTEQQISPFGDTPPLPPPLKEMVLAKLDTWSFQFDNMMQRDSWYETNFETYRLKSLLRLQHIIAWIFLSSYGPGKEMGYDDFLPQFQQAVAIASEVAAAHERYSGSLKPTFTPEIGVIPALYIIGSKCRHPLVRREVLGILRRQTIREAVWDSISAARVVERVIEVEEAGSEEGRTILSMKEIPVWQRIEALSWVRVVSGQSATALDITYTFCGRDGLFNESLIM